MIIADNRKAFHDYFITEKYEAGIVLLGWEVKAIRAGLVQLRDGYVIEKNGALWLLGGNISPLPQSSAHAVVDPLRTRKLLLHQQELSKIIGRIREKGMTVVPLNIHLKLGKIKLEIALAKGKLNADKRDSLKEKDWLREQQQVMKKIMKKSAFR